MATAPYVVGSGKHRFEVHEEWAGSQDDMGLLAASVTVDSKDRVYCFCRNKENPVVVFDREGTLLRSWGANEFAFPHTIRADTDDNLWIVDRDLGQMLLYTPEGRLIRTIGTRGFRSDTGVRADDFRSDAYRDVKHGGGPFNLPTDIDVAPSGEMFMTDGYGNARVHKFAADGTYVSSWGEPGTAPGQFNLPHGVWVTRDGRLLIADRENDRVQVFDQSGKLLNIWNTKLIGPAAFYVDRDDVVYIVEHNAGLVSVLTIEGERLAQWGDPSFRSCHGIWGDSKGDIYIVRAGPWGRRRRIVKHVRV